MGVGCGVGAGGEWEGVVMCDVCGNCEVELGRRGGGGGLGGSRIIKKKTHVQ